LYTACRAESNRKLIKVAKKLNKKFRLDDIVLPLESKNLLTEILQYVENQNHVFYKWGFQEKMGLSKGINVLFTGESGTGKTMAAQILANHLNMDIYKIDLSMLVSKFIGETEQNINKIFEEAKSSNSIIFFDEADAIFGKRTEISHSHDRYSNIEVDYLLQKLEEHDEIVILASNLKQNIDEAFTRRMQFIINFSFPTEKERLEIWKNVFPEPYPYIDKENCDFDFLAKNFKISGAMIKNIALSAAFMAASDPTQSTSESKRILMRHIVLAIKKELEKKGTPVLKSDFGIYSELL
jgi:SpoVK/Ycf46/Vps4 family AAA+-type ATPase